MLSVENQSVSYGGLKALDRVSISVRASQFVAIVGPNGAGKTTLFKAISGTVPVESGRIVFDGAVAAAQPLHGQQRGAHGAASTAASRPRRSAAPCPR